MASPKHAIPVPSCEKGKTSIFANYPALNDAVSVKKTPAKADRAQIYDAGLHYGGAIF
ncbi:hypothetical protein UYSO10_2055 [Kosakonia radicincitans]|nr:hypothetical protein UYSO10_2055 [Kosakonia radicincitans]